MYEYTGSVYNLLVHTRTHTPVKDTASTDVRVYILAPVDTRASRWRGRERVL